MKSTTERMDSSKNMPEWAGSKGRDNNGDLPYPLEPLCATCDLRDGTRVQLGRWKVAMVAVVDEPSGRRRYLASTHIHNGLDDREVGFSLLQKIEQSKRDWELVYVKDHVYVWPTMRAAALPYLGDPEDPLALAA